MDIIPQPDPPRAKPVRDCHPTRWLQLVLREGRKRQIRHMTAAVGFPLLRLVRVAIGSLRLQGLRPGEWRELSETELSTLRQSLSGEREKPHAKTPRRKEGQRKGVYKVHH